MGTLWKTSKCSDKMRRASLERATGWASNWVLILSSYLRWMMLWIRILLFWNLKILKQIRTWMLSKADLSFYGWGTWKIPELQWLVCSHRAALGQTRKQPEILLTPRSLLSGDKDSLLDQTLLMLLQTLFSSRPWLLGFRVCLCMSNFSKKSH